MTFFGTQPAGYRAFIASALASFAFACGSADAAVILKASINHFGTTELNSNDLGFSPSQLAVRAHDLTNTQGSGNIGFVGGIGVLKGQGAIVSNLEAEGFASADVSDIIFRHSDAAACQPSCTAQIPVSVAAQIDGGFSLFPNVLRARARASANLSVTRGNTLLGRSDFHVDSDPSLDGLGPFVETLAVNFFAETDVPYRLSMSLGLDMGALRNFFGNNTGIKADFANTFTLDPEAVFQVGPDIVVSSATAGIVDNQIVHLLPNTGSTSAPEPPAIALFALGVVAVTGLATTRRRHKNRRQLMNQGLD